MKRLMQAGLSLRIIALLSLALLPLGAIAAYQASRLSEAAQERSSDALIALTEQAAFRERQVIERAIGAANALGTMLNSIKDDPQACERHLANYVKQSQSYSFVGFQRTDGLITCSSAGGRYDYSDTEAFKKIVADPRTRVFADRTARISRTSVMVIMHPARDAEGTLTGFVIISVPHSNFEPNNDLNPSQGPFILITFNSDGTILTSENNARVAREKLPEELDLASLAQAEPRTFAGTSAGGEEREYAVVPLVPGTVFALGSWGTDIPMLTKFAPIGSTVFTSALMWLVSIAVAFFAVHQLVVRGLKKLSQQVRAFADTRAIPQSNPDGQGELGDLQSAFLDMAETTIRDEAALEDAVHEKKVLLKEVHHRVKNNLQLISSIMNMQLRRNVSPETAEIVRRLQDRVTALASIHRTLYQAQDMGAIDVSTTLRTIVNQIVAVGMPDDTRVTLSTEFEPVILYPDQAVPLSLLASEAVTNALKYVGGDVPKIAVSLRLSDEGEATLEVVNSIAPQGVASNAHGTRRDAGSEAGLGTQLIRAFVMQLDGKVTQDDGGGTFALKVQFPVISFVPDSEADALTR